MGRVDSRHIPYVRLRAALDAGDLRFFRQYAQTLQPLGLADALDICALIGDQDPSALERASVRWIGRFALEAKAVSLKDVSLAAEAFQRLPIEPRQAMETLKALYASRET
jgi:hypothetical protein